MLAAKSSFRFDTSSLQRNLDNILNDRVTAAMRMYAESAATMLEAYMKANRMWTDRTGMAKARLSAKVQEVSQGFRIVLAHGVSYGLWLELANEKKYAIIQPTILAKSSEVMDGFANLLDKLR